MRAKYTEAARSVEGLFGYPTGREGVLALGYEPALVAAADPGLVKAFCGVGNPFSVVVIQPGMTVLDVGCGAGFDLYVAAQLTGPSGMVMGVDLTEAMMMLARENLKKSGIANADVGRIDGEGLPFGENTFDRVISNGVINLSPDKEALFGEIYRVLRPGGRLGYADVVLEKDLPQGTAGSAEAWAQ